MLAAQFMFFFTHFNVIVELREKKWLLIYAV